MTAMGESASHSADVIVAHPTRAARGSLAGMLWAIVAPLAVVALGKLFAPGGHGPPPWGIPAMLAVALPGIVYAFWAARRNRGPARARVANRSILLGEPGKQRVVSRADITSAFVMPLATGRERLDLELGGGERIEVEYAAGGAAKALRALGLDPSRHTTRVPLYAANAPLVYGAVGIAGGVFAWMMAAAIVHDAARGLVPFFETGLGIALAALTAIPFVLGGYALFQRPLVHVVIGREGVEIGLPSFSKKSRHVRFAETSRVTVEPVPGTRVHTFQIVLHVDDGEKVRFGYYYSPEATPPAEAVALRDAIDAARVQFAGALAPTGLALLDTKKDGSWLAGLRDVARAEASYRGAAIARERLVELVDDPRVSPRHRIAAAYVLKERGDDDGLARVRVAADTTASPKVRVALAAIADGTEDEHALEAAAQEESEREAHER